MRRVTLTAMCVTTALALYVTSGSPLCLMVAGVMAVCGLVGERINLAQRGLGVVTVLAVLATFLVEPPLPRASGFLFVPGLAFSGGLFSCLGTTLLMLRRNVGWERYLVLVTTTVTMLVAGNTTYSFPYGYTVIAYTLFMLLFIRGDHFRLRLGSVVSGLLVVGLAAVFALSLSSGQAGFRTFLTSFQFWSASMNFGDTASIQTQGGAGGDAVLLRVFAEQPPLYLASRRYVEYQDQTWQAADGSPVQPEPDGDPTYLVRDGAPNDEPPVRVELTTLRPEALPLPLEAVAVSANLQTAHLTEGGDLLVRHSGAGFDGSYVITQGVLSRRESPQLLERCLRAEVDPYVSSLARELAGQRSDKFKVFALRQFFHDNFEYGFGYPFDKADDPVLTFLKERPAAHCEVYATTMTLMARSVGVPARYVQGFLVREKNDWGDYWVSRERDAHAWVEVYLEGIGWTVVDPTPPGVSEKIESDTTWKDLQDVLKRMVQRGWSYVARGPQALLSGLYRTVSTHWPGLVVLLLLVVGWRFRDRLRRLWRAADSLNEIEQDPQIERMHALLQQFRGVVPEQPQPPGFTLLEWADLTDRGADFLRLYSELRYSSVAPTGEDVDRLETLLEELRRIPSS